MKISYFYNLIGFLSLSLLWSTHLLAFPVDSLKSIEDGAHSSYQKAKEANLQEEERQENAKKAMFLFSQVAFSRELEANSLSTDYRRESGFFKKIALCNKRRKKFQSARDNYKKSYTCAELVLSLTPSRNTEFEEELKRSSVIIFRKSSEESGKFKRNSVYFEFCLRAIWTNEKKKGTIREAVPQVRGLIKDKNVIFTVKNDPLFSNDTISIFSFMASLDQKIEYYCVDSDKIILE